MTALEWKQKGNYMDVFGHQIFYIYNKSEKPTVAFLHGFPSSSYDYFHTLPYFSNNYSYIIHDHLGFGLSDKPINYSYSLIEQADMAIELWRKLGIEQVHLVSHDYGTSVANEILVKRLRGFEPIKIQSATFCNGSMHIELAKILLVQKLLKHPFFGKYAAALTNEFLFILNMKKIWFDKSLFNTNEIRIIYQMCVANGGKKVLHKASQYINERTKFWHRWIGSLPMIDIPVHILWAQQDPIAIKAIAELLHQEMKNSSYTKIDSCGHYPMLEQPKLWADKTIHFLETIK